MTLDSKVPDGRRSTEKWDNHKFDGEARQPGEQAALQRHRRRHRARRRVGGGVARRARLQREGPHLPRLAPPRALHRRAGRHQRGEELQERRRQHPPPVLRHDQGRRLPAREGERVPPRAGHGQHHRPVRRAGRAVRPRVRRPARQPLLRRRAGVAHVLRPGPDRPAAAARCVPGADAPGARWAPSSCTRAPRCSTSWSRTAGPPASCAATSSPARCSRCRAHAVVLATGGYGNVFFLSTNAKNSNVTAHRGARTEAGRVHGQPVLHPDPPHVHPGQRRLPVEAHADERVAAQRRPGLGAAAAGRPALAGPDPRGRARLLPRAPLPGVRQPRAP